MNVLTGKAGNSYLLDTNIVVAILNDEAGLEPKLRGTTTYISTIVLGELYYGARNSARAADNLNKINDFVVSAAFVDCDKLTADYYALVKHQLKRKGRPIPENDIWIAATALQHGLTLVSRDGHFKEVDDLSLDTW